MQPPDQTTTHPPAEPWHRHAGGIIPQIWKDPASHLALKTDFRPLKEGERRHARLLNGSIEATLPPEPRTSSIPSIPTKRGQPSTAPAEQTRTTFAPLRYKQGPVDDNDASLRLHTLSVGSSVTGMRARPMTCTLDPHREPTSTPSGLGTMEQEHSPNTSTQRKQTRFAPLKYQQPSDDGGHVQYTAPKPLSLPSVTDSRTRPPTSLLLSRRNSISTPSDKGAPMNRDQSSTPSAKRRRTSFAPLRYQQCSNDGDVPYADPKPAARPSVTNSRERAAKRTSGPQRSSASTPCGQGPLMKRKRISLAAAAHRRGSWAAMIYQQPLEEDGDATFKLHKRVVVPPAPARQTRASTRALDPAQNSAPTRGGQRTPMKRVLSSVGAVKGRRTSFAPLRYQQRSDVDVDVPHTAPRPLARPKAMEPQPSAPAQTSHFRRNPASALREQGRHEDQKRTSFDLLSREGLPGEGGESHDVALDAWAAFERAVLGPVGISTQDLLSLVKLVQDVPSTREPLASNIPPILGDSPSASAPLPHAGASATTIPAGDISIKLEDIEPPMRKALPAADDVSVHLDGTNCRGEWMAREVMKLGYSRTELLALVRGLNNGLVGMDLDAPHQL